MTVMFAIGPALALAAALVAGADWSTFRGDSAQRGVAPGQLADDLVLRWRFETGAGISSWQNKKAACAMGNERRLPSDRFDRSPGEENLFTEFDTQ